MTITHYIPAPPLNTYIDNFYYVDGAMPYPRERVMPIPWLNLKINFGGAFQVYEADQHRPIAACTESWSVGLWSKAHVIDWSPDMQFFIVNFKPGGAYPFFQVPLSELHNQVVSLDALWGRFAAEVREQLYAAPTLHDRFALLEQLLLSRLGEPSHGQQIVQAAIKQIAAHHGALSIGALSDQIGISQKHLIAQFNRFHHILQMIDPSQPVNWTTVAHQSHYYDQPHFNKDFEWFTGHSPSDYLRIRRRVLVENPKHAQNRLLLPTG